MDFFTTGNEIVDQIGKLSITGDVIPIIWYETILNDKGKPAYLSILMLADIMYWYKPVEVRDERTGRVFGWKKRFEGDMLQRDLSEWSDKYGESESTIRRSLDLLINIGAVIKHNKHIETGSGKIRNNVLFWEIVPSVVYELTYPSKERITEPIWGYTRETYRVLSEEEVEILKKSGKKRPTVKNERSHMSNLKGGSCQIGNEADSKFESRHMLKMKGAICQKNKEANVKNDISLLSEGVGGISINITNGEKEYINPSIRQSIPQSTSGDIELYEEQVNPRDLIVQNIELNRLKSELSGTPLFRALEDVYAVLCEVVCIARDSIKINTSEFPYELVRERFLQLRYEHIKCVIDRVMKENDKVVNMRGYLLTALYNESFNRY